jgi:hypothetical protein
MPPRARKQCMWRCRIRTRVMSNSFSGLSNEGELDLPLRYMGKGGRVEGWVTVTKLGLCRSIGLQYIEVINITLECFL